MVRVIRRNKPEPEPQKRVIRRGKSSKPKQPKMPPFPTVKGKRDKRFKDCVLVAVKDRPNHPLFPVVGQDIAPNTFYRVIPGQKVRCMVTVGAGGTNYAWDSCGMCHNYFLQCTCTKNLLHPDSIEWCIRKEAGWVKGEPIDFDVKLHEYTKERRRPAPKQNSFGAKKFGSGPRSKPKPKEPFYTGWDDGPPVRVPPKASTPMPKPGDKPRRVIKTSAGSKAAAPMMSMEDMDAAAAAMAAELTGEKPKRVIRRGKK